MLDEIYDHVHRFGMSLKSGFTSHQPMVAEALCELGLAQDAHDWVMVRQDDLTPPAPAAPAIKNWQDGLGRWDQIGAYQAFFAGEFAQGDWQAKTDEWADRLAPGYAAAATHGIIRVGHAVRALTHADTPARRRELANGFALWAGAYQPLATADGDVRDAPIAQLLAEVPLVPVEARKNSGLITTALAALEGVPAFGPVIHWPQIGPDTPAEAARAFAHLFRTQAHDPLTAIVFTHAITSLVAVLNIAPNVRAETVEKLVRYGWQTGAALKAAYWVDGSPGSPHDAEDRDSLIAAALAHGDDHVIKLTEACLNLHARTGDEIFLTLPGQARALLTYDIRKGPNS